MPSVRENSKNQCPRNGAAFRKSISAGRQLQPPAISDGFLLFRKLGVNHGTTGTLAGVRARGGPCRQLLLADETGGPNSYVL